MLDRVRGREWEGVWGSKVTGRIRSRLKYGPIGATQRRRPITEEWLGVRLAGLHSKPEPLSTQRVSKLDIVFYFYSSTIAAVCLLKSSMLKHDYFSQMASSQILESEHDSERDDIDSEHGDNVDDELPELGQNQPDQLGKKTVSINIDENVSVA